MGDVPWVDKGAVDRDGVVRSKPPHELAISPACDVPLLQSLWRFPVKEGGRAENLGEFQNVSHHYYVEETLNSCDIWDVCELGERDASADSSIRRERPNAIDRLLDTHPLIRAVAFNGTTARRLYDRHFARRMELAYLALPSTSPAHATIDFSAKLARWTALREILEQDERT